MEGIGASSEIIGYTVIYRLYCVYVDCSGLEGGGVLCVVAVVVVVAAVVSYFYPLSPDGMVSECYLLISYLSMPEAHIFVYHERKKD